MCNMKEKFPKLLKDINPLIGRSTDKSGHNKKKKLVYITVKLQIDGQTDRQSRSQVAERKKEDCLLQKNDNLSDTGFSKNGITMKENLQNMRKFYIQ